MDGENFKSKNNTNLKINSAFSALQTSSTVPSKPFGNEEGAYYRNSFAPVLDPIYV